MMVESFAKKTKFSTYNIGSGKQTDLNEIINAIEATTGLKAKVLYADAPKTFLQSSYVSINRFINEFGNESMTSLLDGLKKTID
jgi:UDP-glucose 4-epimerase